LYPFARSVSPAVRPNRPAGRNPTGGYPRGRSASTTRSSNRPVWPGALPAVPTALLIPGTADVVHLEANIAAGAVTITDATLATPGAVPSRSAQMPLG
jgi:hypothetical protein